MVPTYTLLTLALLALWLMPARFGAWAQAYGWVVAFSLAVISALATGIVQPVALLWLAPLAFGAVVFARSAPGSWQRMVSGAIVFVVGVGLMSHQLPGFNNPRVLAAVRLTPDAIPYSLRLNFDKAAFALVSSGSVTRGLPRVRSGGRCSGRRRRWQRDCLC